MIEKTISRNLRRKLPSSLILQMSHSSCVIVSSFVIFTPAVFQAIAKFPFLVDEKIDFDLLYLDPNVFHMVQK